MPLVVLALAVALAVVLAASVVVTVAALVLWSVMTTVAVAVPLMAAVVAVVTVAATVATSGDRFGAKLASSNCLNTPWSMVAAPGVVAAAAAAETAVMSCRPSSCAKWLDGESDARAHETTAAAVAATAVLTGVGAAPRFRCGRCRSGHRARLCDTIAPRPVTGDRDACPRPTTGPVAAITAAAAAAVAAVATAAATRDALFLARRRPGGGNRSPP